MNKYTGLGTLLGLDVVVLIFLIYWWVTSGFDPLRDLLMIGVFGALNIVIFLSQRKTINKNNNGN